MYNFFNKNGMKLALGVGLLFVGLHFFMIYSGFQGGEYSAADDLTKLSSDQMKDINFFNFGLKSAVFLTAIAFLLAFVVFGIWDLIKYPKRAMRTLGALIVIGILFVIFYSTSTMETAGSLGMTHEKFNITENVSKFISAGIKTSIALMVLAALGVILGEAFSAIK